MNGPITSMIPVLLQYVQKATAASVQLWTLQLTVPSLMPGGVQIFKTRFLATEDKNSILDKLST
eukprot:scaffold721_cov131-Cylindrotheca_fusiformis.AAC.37